MTAQQPNLRRRLWRTYRGLPRVIRVAIVVAALGALVDFAFLSRPGEEQGVRAAVAAAVRDATGTDPASSCSALSATGLGQLVGQFGGGEAAATGADPVAECRQVVLQLRSEATPQQLADIAHGRVTAVQFRGDGSALVVYLAADRRLGAELTLSRHDGRWLIDSVTGGAVAGAQ